MTIPKNLTTRPIEVIDSLMTIHDAALKMLEQSIGALLVLDDDKLVGIVSERDLMNKVIVQDRSAKETLVEAIMTHEVHTVSLQDTLEHALQLMSKHHIRHLPLLDDSGKPVCMLSFRDLYEYKLKQLDQKNQALSALVQLGINVDVD